MSAPLGAFLVAGLPMAGVMAVDVGTALLAIVPLIFIRVPQPAGSSEAPAEGGAVRALWGEVVAGVRYLWQREGHFALLAMVTVVNLFLVPAFSLLPLLITGRGGDALEFGWMTSAFGVGTLAGGLALAAWGGFRRQMATSLSALTALGLAVLGLAGAQWGPFVLSLISIFTVGFFVPLVNGPIHALLQATIAPELQGRIFTLYGSLATLAAPAGLLLAAPLAETLGVLAWYGAGGVVCLLMGLVGFALPRVLQLGGEVPEEGTPREDEEPTAQTGAVALP